MQKENPTFYQVPKKCKPLELMAFVDQNPFPCEKNMEFRFSPRYVLRVHPESGSSEGSGHPEGGRSGKLPWKPVIRISFSKHCNTKKKKTSPNNQDNQKKILPNFGVHGFFLVFFFFKNTPTTETQIPAPHGFSTIPPPPASLLSPQTIARPPTWKKSPARQAHPQDPHRHHLRLAVGEHQVLEKLPQVDEIQNFSADLCHKNVKHLKSECSREKRCVCVCVVPFLDCAKQHLDDHLDFRGCYLSSPPG